MQNKNCNYFNNNLCKSCSLLYANSSELPELPEEIKNKFLPWQRAESAFNSRAKAKMSVSGNKQKPIIGILDSKLKGIELLNCPLHKKIINQALTQLNEQIKTVEPYSIKDRRGNLKGLILQTNHNQDHLRIRFIVKDSSSQKTIKEILPNLDCKLSTSLNIQSIPHQIPEGEIEYHLNGEELLWENYNNIKIAFPAQSFMQVTPDIAALLYKTASEKIKNSDSKIVLDLFCGAGAFALHSAKYSKKVYGIEISKEAVKAAKHSAKTNKITNTEFIDVDLLKDISDINPDTVICNPPRRGLGKFVIDFLINKQPNLILYSSCDVNNFLKDFEQLSPIYELKEITPFEMFPLTKHFEVLAVLEKR